MWTTTEYYTLPTKGWKTKTLQANSPKGLDNLIHQFIFQLKDDNVVQSIQYGGYVSGINRGYTAMVVYIHDKGGGGDEQWSYIKWLEDLEQKCGAKPDKEHYGLVSRLEVLQHKLGVDTIKSSDLT